MMANRGSSGSNNVRDIVVVGAGLAGSIFAGLAVRAGFSVLLVERSEAYRDRIRGEVIHPWGVRVARQAGIDHLFSSADAMEIVRYQLYRDREPVLRDDEGQIAGASGVAGEPPPMLGFSHPAAQQTALDWALSGGAELLRPAAVIEVRQGERPKTTIRVKGRTETVESRLVVGAGGATSAMRRLTGGGSFADPEHHRIGGGVIAGSHFEPDTFHRSNGEGIATWVFGRRPGEFRIFIVSAREVIAANELDRSPEHFLRYVATQFPPAILADAKAAGPFGFFSNAESRPERIAGEGIVLIGDAAGRSDPSRGHGTSLLVQDAVWLTELLESHHDWNAAIQEFGHRRRRAFSPIRALTTWEAAINYEVGPDAANRRERFFRAREVDPSLGGFLDIEVTGPERLEVTEEARRHFFGEDLP